MLVLVSVLLEYNFCAQVLFSYKLAYIKSVPSPFFLEPSSTLSSVEWSEELLPLMRVEFRAVRGYGKLDTILYVVGGNYDTPTFGRVLGCVINERTVE